MKRERPVFIAASPGGHLSQLLIITNHLPFRIVISYDKFRTLSDDPSICLVLQAHETRRNIPLHLVNLFKYCAYIALFRPKAVISNGGPFVLPLFVVARILAISTIYIDTLSRVEDLSNTAKLVHRLNLSKHFLVQWPHLTQRYRRAVYAGSIIDLSDSRDT